MDRLRAPPKKECQRCGAFVTCAYAEAFGDRDGRVHGCVECTTQGERARGLAAGIDIKSSGRTPTLPNEHSVAGDS